MIERIRDLLEKNYFSLTEIAKRVGISRSTLYKILKQSYLTDLYFTPINLDRANLTLKANQAINTMSQPVKENESNKIDPMVKIRMAEQEHYQPDYRDLYCDRGRRGMFVVPFNRAKFICMGLRKQHARTLDTFARYSLPELPEVNQWRSTNKPYYEYSAGDFEKLTEDFIKSLSKILEQNASKWFYRPLTEASIPMVYVVDSSQKFVIRFRVTNYLSASDPYEDYKTAEFVSARELSPIEFDKLITTENLEMEGFDAREQEKKINFPEKEEVNFIKTFTLPSLEREQPRVNPLKKPVFKLKGKRGNLQGYYVFIPEDE